MAQISPVVLRVFSSRERSKPTKPTILSPSTATCTWGSQYSMASRQ